MFIGDGARARLLVVAFYHRSEDELHPVAGLGDFAKQVGVLFRVPASIDDDGHIHGGCDLFGRFRRLLGRSIESVGVGAHELEGDQFGPVNVDGLLRPGHGIRDDILVWFQCGIRPVFRRRVVNLDGNARGVRHLPLEKMKGVGSLAPHRQGLGPFAQRYFSDLSRIGRFRYCKCHLSFPPSLLTVA